MIYFHLVRTDAMSDKTGNPPPYQTEEIPQQGNAPQQQYPQPGAQQVVVVQQQFQATPTSNQILAWISCLCCFCPLGIVAVYKSMQSDTCAGNGDMEGARSNGESAKKWAIAAIITQIVLVIAIIIIHFIVIAAGVSTVMKIDFADIIIDDLFATSSP